MNAECDFRPVGASKTVSSVVPHVARLILAIFVAMVALACLCDRLSVARSQVQAGHVDLVGQPGDASECVLRDTLSGIPAICRHPTLTANKRIDPPNPETGGVVTITFTITGLGLKQQDVVLVQDVSGSMKDTDTLSGLPRIEVAKAAAITFVKDLSDTDRAALVAYSNSAWVVQGLTSDKDVVTAAIRGLTAGSGWTNIGDGIQEGYDELINSGRSLTGPVKAMVLMSDGNANCVDPGHCPGSIPVAERHALDKARMARDCGIMVYTIGWGDVISTNEDLLRTIAYTTGGEYYHSADGSDLETIYHEIALALRNVVITDVLPPGVDVDCSLFPPGTCTQEGTPEDGLTTTIVISTSNQKLITDPLTLSFTATVNLDPPDQYKLNIEGSRICYDGPVITPCQDFENPTVTVGGRKITGIVFADMDCNGHCDDNEDVMTNVVVTTSSGLASRTDQSGVYLFQTSERPTLSVVVSVPTDYLACTPVITQIPPVSGTYRWSFGLRLPVGGIVLGELNVEPYPVYHGDFTTLHYSVTNQDQEYSAVGGTVLIEDSTGRNLDGGSFDEVPPDGTMPGYSVPFSVPQDIVLTLTARATQSGVPVSAPPITGLLCPTDTYEPDDSLGQAKLVYTDTPQLHDFHRPGDQDRVLFRLYPGDEALYAFLAFPQGPEGVDICLDLDQGYTTLKECNDEGHKSPVLIMRELSCSGAVACNYYLRVYSLDTPYPSGCGTDYLLYVKEVRNPSYIYLPIVLKNS